MHNDNTPNSCNDLLAALADGELDLRQNPDALAKIAQDPQAAERIACQQQLRQAVGQAMDGPQMKCPASLAATLKAMASEAGDVEVQAPAAPLIAATTSAATSTTTPTPPTTSAPASYVGPPVIARIGRWAPAAVAAVLLLAAGVLFMQSNLGQGGINEYATSFLTVDQINSFGGRHGQCSIDTNELKQAERFGDAAEFDQLPGRLGSYFQTSTDGMQLSLDGIGYSYALAGTCNLPGQGAVHIIYRNQSNPEQSISLWVIPASDRHAALEPDHVYSEAGADSMHPVIFWREGGLLYYLVGDSIQDANQAVQQLRQPA